MVLTESPGCRPVSYTVEFQDSSGANLNEWFDDAADQGSATAIEVAAGAGVTGVDASLAMAASISGVVTDAAGAPLQGISVYSSDLGTGVELTRQRMGRIGSLVCRQGVTRFVQLFERLCG